MCITQEARTDSGKIPVAWAGREHRFSFDDIDAMMSPGGNVTGTAPVGRPHKAGGAALGAGFHLHAHATPPRREPDPQHHPANTG
jgi:hypothetical protein